ncbi:MAG: hypothetical protein ABFS38_21510 [Bacteroidota bacterium]
MKAPAAILGFFILSVFVFNDSMAQKASFTSPGGWTIGFGAGTAYQKSDLVNSKGFGLDFILGSQLYQKENAFLSVDWKFRFLAGQNKAYDHRINPDNTYSNISYNFYNFDLEVGLTLNRLRERTRIVLTGFAGAGITYGSTSTDLYDAGNNLYDFGSIDPNLDSKLVYNDLIALSDGDFETSLVNKVAILPTAGLFVGYQISRSITLGVEFKTNFYLTEKNSLVGIDLDNRVLAGSGIDRNNYVSLGFRWNFRGGSSYTGATTNYSSGVMNNNTNTTGTYSHVVPVSLPHPSVNITEPLAESYHTVSPSQTIRAIINNVSGSDNISFSRNGFPINLFAYNVNTKTFVANVRLLDGENSFRIKATNQTSTAEDLVTITLDNPPEEVMPAPLVEFTSPSGNQHTSSADRIVVTASVKNISSKENIQLTLNGIDTPFEYNSYSGLVKTSFPRTTDVNDLIINGFNESGSAQDQLSVHFTNPEKIATPSVWFINPPYPVEVNDKRFSLSAETQNVPGRNNVALKINGTSISNFSFSANGAVSFSLYLSEGVNTIEITAKNESGTASERTSITYLKPVYQEPVYQEAIYQEPVYQEPVYQEPVYQESVIGSSPPVIHIINPSTHPFRTNERSEELRATVLNVHSKENIILNINGSSTRNFNYNHSTKELIARAALREGENVLSINAQNESGRDVKELLFIKETRPCPPPQIRLIDPVGGQISTRQQTYALRADVRNITNINQLRLLANGKTVSYSFDNNILSSPVPLAPGLNTLSLSAVNECGEDNASARITFNSPVVIVPCTPPTVSFTLHKVNREDATHELRGSVNGVKNKADISLTLDGRANSGFQFAPSTGELSAKFKLTPGSHTLVVTVNNDCGTDTKSESVSVEEKEEACGIRFNPGNSAWQFCLVTPSGTFSRDNLANSNFSYTGSASSLYINPIGEGGNATVNGRPYAIRAGQYYLFTGRLNVTVSTKNPGSMGHWSVCISADKAPVSGNGNNRPESPCEVENNESVKGDKSNNRTNNRTRNNSRNKR